MNVKIYTIGNNIPQMDKNFQPKNKKGPLAKNLEKEKSKTSSSDKNG